MNNRGRVAISILVFPAFRFRTQRAWWAPAPDPAVRRRRRLRLSRTASEVL